MPGKVTRRRSASMKQLSTDETAALDHQLTPMAVITEELNPTSTTISSVADTTLAPPDATSETDVVVEAPDSKKSLHKVKSSRRASFQLSNTVNNLAKESGVEHLIGIVNEGGRGDNNRMGDQIKDLKDEIERKGLTKYIDTVSGYSMNGEIKMLKKVLADNININMSGMATLAPHLLTSPSNSTSPPSTLPSPGARTGSENMVRTLAELRAANETIAVLEKKLTRLQEDADATSELEEQLCALEDQLLKANNARVDGVAQCSQLQGRVAELEQELAEVSEEATATIAELEEVLDGVSAQLQEAQRREEEASKGLVLALHDKELFAGTISKLEDEARSMEAAAVVLHRQAEHAAAETQRHMDALSASLTREEALQKQVADGREQNAGAAEEFRALTTSACAVLDSEKAEAVAVAGRLQEQVSALQASAVESSKEAAAREAALEKALAAARRGSEEAAEEIAVLRTRVAGLEGSQSACESASAKLLQAETALAAALAEKTEALSSLRVLEQQVAARKGKGEAGAGDAGSSKSSAESGAYSAKQLNDDMQFLMSGPEGSSDGGPASSVPSTAELELELGAARRQLQDVERLCEELKKQFNLQTETDARPPHVLREVLREATAALSGKDKMQNEIKRLLSKLTAADKDSEDAQNEHEAEVFALQQAADVADKELRKVKASLKLSLRNCSKLQEVVDEQNVFLKDAADSLDESDRRFAALTAASNGATSSATSADEAMLRSELEALVLSKDAELVKTSADNDFHRKRVESLQRKVVELSSARDTEREKSRAAQEIKTLWALTEEESRMNKFLVDVIEREHAEKLTLKAMLQTAYSEADRHSKSTHAPVDKKKSSTRRAEDLWGAMNKTPAFAGYDVIFKIDTLMPLGGFERQHGSIVERLHRLQGETSTLPSTPVDFLTMAQGQHQLDSRLTSTHGLKNGPEVFQEVTSDASSGQDTSQGARGGGRKIVTRLGSGVQVQGAQGAQGAQGGEDATRSSSSVLSSIFSTSSRRLSKHECQPHRGTSSVISTDNVDTDIDCKSDLPSHSGVDESKVVTDSQTPPPSRKVEISETAVAPADATPPEKTPLETSFFSVSKTSSLFASLNKTEKETNDVEVNGIGNLYGSERIDDRRHSVNLSNQKGRRKASFSFVSENPCAQDMSQAPDTNCATDESPGRARSKTNINLFGRIAEGAEHAGSSGTGSGPGEDRSSVMARANLLSRSFHDDQEESGSSSHDSPSSFSFSASSFALHCIAEQGGKKGFSATAGGPPSPVSVGAQNAKRFGRQNNLMRTGSNDVSSAGASRAPRSTLMAVDSETLEAVRQKARRRASASRELAAQTSLLKQQMMSARREQESKDSEQ